ncbi:DUF5605 domain-containing protein [Gryllotalpicola koreensis]|uniref:DUF5605 domain-containing protein n=1 Tax=Gryllotalpicola koreensis TaxID=993086 RepID=A0ABP7ZTC4_9MICO
MGYTKDATVGAVAGNAAARAVIERYLPDAFDSPLLQYLPLMPIASITGGALFLGQTPEDLEPMWSELAALDTGAPVPPPAQPPARPELIDDGGTRTPPAVTALGRFEQWGVIEITLRGPADGNPYTAVDLHAVFTQEGAAPIRVGGFYDGDGVYRVRFHPPAAGRWRFSTRSNAASLDALEGEFDAAPASGDNHGPVQVAETFHFAHRDGTRFTPIGTTAYAWTHQGEALETKTLKTLGESAFRKVRMCVFPKSYLFNTEEPPRYPYQRDDTGWDFSRFDPEFFRHLERRILDLQDLGIEADLILFHAYDRWGFSQMPQWADDLYLRYLVRRLGAFRSVWWSLANEYDLLRTKTEADWERFAAIIASEDHVGHLTSIHNCFGFYDHSRPWVTHCSIQRIDVYRTAENTDEWRQEYGKPVVIDECAYEGDIDQGWGNIGGRELVRRAWEGAIRGGYVTHGETYYNDREELWWSKGGELVGESPARFAFLARILAEAPHGVLEPLPSDWDVRWAGTDDHRIAYFGFGRPRFRTIATPPDSTWDVDLIDTWNMTVEPLPEPQKGRFTVSLPGREFMAIRLRRRTA